MENNTECVLVYCNDAEQSLTRTVIVNESDYPLATELRKRIAKQMQKSHHSKQTGELVGQGAWMAVPMIRREHRDVEGDAKEQSRIFRVSCSLRVVDTVLAKVIGSSPPGASSVDATLGRVKVPVYIELSTKVQSNDMSKKALQHAAWELLQKYCADLKKTDVSVLQEEFEELTDENMSTKEAVEKGLIFVLAKDQFDSYKGKPVTRAQCLAMQQPISAPETKIKLSL